MPQIGQLEALTNIIEIFSITHKPAGTRSTVVEGRENVNGRSNNAEVGLTASWKGASVQMQVMLVTP